MRCAAAVLLLLLTVACSDGTDEPVSLGDGFTVVDGTELLGEPVPAGVDEASWVATSIIDDAEPREVVDAYLRQAEEDGLVVHGEVACGLDLEVYVCAGFARSADRVPPRSLSVAAIRGTRDDVVSNHVVVHHSTDELQWEHGAPFVHESGPDDAPAPPDRLPRPEVGDGIGTAGETRHEVVVQEGSRAAGPSRLHLGDATGGVVAILEVTGDPDEVLGAYLDQLPDDPSVGPPEVRRIGGAEVTTVSYSEAGGDQFRFTMVERPDRPTWLVVEGSHD